MDELCGVVMSCGLNRGEMIMHKLMIKKMEKTWEVPLLKDKLGGVNLCAKVYGETFYAPTFKDGAALAGCIETPLVFMKDGEKYRVYTLRKVRSGDRNLSTEIIWNDSGRSLYVKVKGTYTWTEVHEEPHIGDKPDYEEPGYYEEEHTNYFSFGFTLDSNCIARIVVYHGKVSIENVANGTTIKTYSDGGMAGASYISAEFAEID